MKVVFLILLFNFNTLSSSVSCFEKFEHYDKSENIYTCTALETHDWVEAAINETCDSTKYFSVFTKKEKNYQGLAQYYICCTISDGWNFEYTPGEVNSGCWKRINLP